MRNVGYIQLLDQEGTPWYVWVGQSTREIAMGTSRPSGVQIASGLELSWFECSIPDGNDWKVYSGTWGELVIVPATTALLGTGSTETVQLRDGLANHWYPAITNLGTIRLRRMPP
jgi:hypothetical protein